MSLPSVELREFSSQLFRLDSIYCYNFSMKSTEALSPSSSSYLGHVKNGVVVLDVQASLNEGEAVRIEPLNKETQITREQADRLAQLQRAFAEWTEEDGKLSDEEADCLHAAP